MKVVAITPVWNESLAMIQSFRTLIEGVREKLNQRGIGFVHYFLDDAALHLPEEYPILVRHATNQGLAHTLLDGYTAVLALKAKADIIIKVDCQEHDPEMIMDIVDNMGHSPIDAMFLPVYYWVKGEPRPLMREMTVQIADFIRALDPISRETVLSTYNVIFPLGYQAYRGKTLSELLPKLIEGMRICEEMTNKPATWGLDLLAILLAAKNDAAKIDFLFGGFSEPWLENRGADKVAAQQVKAETMIQIAERLGCSVG